MDMETTVSAERTKQYRGYTLRQVDWYYAAKRDGRIRFTATTVDELKGMIDQEVSSMAARGR